MKPTKEYGQRLREQLAHIPTKHLSYCDAQFLIRLIAEVEE